MATLSDLAKRMDQLAEATEKKASDIAIEATMAIVEHLAFTTPVDTSKAISNWQVGVGAPVLSNIDAHSPGYLGYTLMPSATETIARARAQLSTKRPGQTIHITNNAPYIVALNNGSSQQAPRDFVSIAVEKGRDIIAAKQKV